MMGHYKFGKWVRQRYADFLPSEYDRSDIYVQSTDVDRTLMSAYSHLAGLYEPKSSKNWDPDIKWRPIPVHTIPEASDLVNPKFTVWYLSSIFFLLLSSGFGCEEALPKIRP